MPQRPPCSQSQAVTTPLGELLGGRRSRRGAAHPGPRTRENPPWPGANGCRPERHAPGGQGRRRRALCAPDRYRPFGVESPCSALSCSRLRAMLATSGSSLVCRASRRVSRCLSASRRGLYGNRSISGRLGLRQRSNCPLPPLCRRRLLPRSDGGGVGHGGRRPQSRPGRWRRAACGAR